jgi:hypothetical protein
VSDATRGQPGGRQLAQQRATQRREDTQEIFIATRATRFAEKTQGNPAGPMMAGETDPAELLPAKIMLLIIELAGPEAALKALPTMSKTWLGLTQQYFGGLETLDTGEVAVLRSCKYDESDTAPFLQKLQTLLRRCGSLATLRVDAGAFTRVFFQDQKILSPDQPCLPADVLSGASLKLKHLDIVGQGSAAVVRGVAQHCPLLESFSIGYMEDYFWVGWNFDTAALRVLKDACPNLCKLSTMNYKIGDQVRVNYDWRLNHEIDDFVQLLREWPSLTSVTLVAQNFDILDQLLMLATDPGSFAGKLLVNIPDPSPMIGGPGLIFPDDFDNRTSEPVPRPNEALVALGWRWNDGAKHLYLLHNQARVSVSYTDLSSFM